MQSMCTHRWLIVSQQGRKCHTSYSLDSRRAVFLRPFSWSFIFDLKKEREIRFRSKLINTNFFWIHIHVSLSSSLQLLTFSLNITPLLFLLSRFLTLQPSISFSSSSHSHLQELTSFSRYTRKFAEEEFLMSC
ncbi:unnamed protein product [Citrullus colocynthis]|uniref:Uncharacterized protein n=1 Tax=Citrullus colocynthis TaxID=252529 RepID=A0ABP0Z7N3_9ROSI